MISRQAVSSFLNLTVWQGIFLKALPFLMLALAGPVLAQVPQGWPAEPLEMTPQPGVTHFQDAALFDAWPFFSEKHIVAGTTAASKIDSSGNRLLTGSLMVAWQEGEVARLSRGAFIIRVSPKGDRIGQAYFGAIPGNKSNSERDYALQALKIAENSVTVSGWARRSSATDRRGPKDSFRAQLSTDLFTTYRTSTRPGAKGIAGESKAQIIPIVPIDPVPLVQETHPNDVEVVNGLAVSCDDSGFGILDQCVPKVADSDDDYVLVFASAQAGEQGGDLATFRFNYPIPEKFPKLTEIQFEVATDDCMTLSVSLESSKAMAEMITVADMPTSLPPVTLCDFGETVISFDVPEEVARDLGYWDSRPEADLVALVDVEVFDQGPSCSTCLGGTAVGLDETTVSTEIADP